MILNIKHTGSLSNQGFNNRSSHHLACKVGVEPSVFHCQILLYTHLIKDDCSHSVSGLQVLLVGCLAHPREHLLYKAWSLWYAVFHLSQRFRMREHLTLRPPHFISLGALHPPRQTHLHCSEKKSTHAKLLNSEYHLLYLLMLHQVSLFAYESVARIIYS